MSDDLRRLRLLRSIHPANGPTDRGLAWAAEEIERLTAERDALRSLLTESATWLDDLAEHAKDWWPDTEARLTNLRDRVAEALGDQ